MKNETIRKLITLNSRFYSENSDSFSATRQNFWPGWKKSLEVIKPLLIQNPKILDLGCGNGRYYKFLIENLSEFKYTGVDFSEELIKLAKESLVHKVHEFIPDEIDKFIENTKSKYDLISIIATLHHIPSAKKREQLLAEASSKLKAGGILLITLWNFKEEKSLQRLIVPQAETEFKSSEFEVGDYLLSWDGTMKARRYCHYFSQIEKTKLISSTTLNVKAIFDTDGRNNRLNTYIVLQKSQ